MKITQKFVQENLEEIKKYLPQEKKVGIVIKNRWTGSIIFESTKTTWREAIEEAKTGADLTDADLTDANLTGANLTRANLTRADLTACLYYFGTSNRNFEALCKAIKTIKHPDGKFEDFRS